MSGAISRHKIRRVTGSDIIDTTDQLAVEEPLEIILQHGPATKQVQQTISVTMRTPGQDRQLAAGFLFTEGIIHNYTEVKMITVEPSGPNTVLLILNEDALPVLPENERNFYTTSSCGVCGKASIDAIRTVSVFGDLQDNIQISGSILYGLHDQLRKAQDIFESTGGLHASALFDLNGQFLTLQEDVGRHNALDKLIGEAFMENKLPINKHILFLSGRASFELVQKAHMAGIRLIAAVGAPSSLAVELAADVGITLAGFLRENRFNIYSAFERIK